jgi:hypothetical protein
VIALKTQFGDAFFAAFIIGRIGRGLLRRYGGVALMRLQ